MWALKHFFYLLPFSFSFSVLHIYNAMSMTNDTQDTSALETSLLLQPLSPPASDLSPLDMLIAALDPPPPLGAKRPLPEFDHLLAPLPKHTRHDSLLDLAQPSQQHSRSLSLNGFDTLLDPIIFPSLLPPPTTTTTTAQDFLLSPPPPPTLPIPVIPGVTQSPHPKPSRLSVPLDLTPTPEELERGPQARPRRQKLRATDDLYTPMWVRNTGQQKEGFCDTCQPGKWLQLKNSAYWYHKQFCHGISSISGQSFQRPLEIRWLDGETLEGLCHQCHGWVMVANYKRRNSVLWYRHAHKCHIYQRPAKF